MLMIETTYEDGDTCGGRPLAEAIEHWQGWTPEHPTIEDFRRALDRANVEVVEDVWTGREQRFVADVGETLPERAEYRITYTDGPYSEAALRAVSA